MHDDPRVYVKPRVTRLLRALGLDVVYERGAGDSVFYRAGDGREVEVLDLVGGYGATLLGHNYPPLVAEAQRMLGSGRPMCVQGSRRELAERLARELSRRVGGNFCVVFGNSGAEAVEAAMKHAVLETGGRTFVALDRAFHGKTLGAIQLNGNNEYRAGLELPSLNVVRVRAGDVASMEAAFAQSTDIAGFIFEPIQAEGGVRPIDPAFARRAAELCRERSVPLIADECQTGLGRTGTFLACESLGVRPDYLILSKALGGGLAKISALLIRRDRYLESFDFVHSSTFAEDDFSSAIALNVLELIDQPLISRCAETGTQLVQCLRQLQATYPDVLAEVRGSGLLLGVEFRRPADRSRFLLRLLAAHDDLVYLLAAYLFHIHRIRVAPTLSDPFTMRIEPSAFLGDAGVGQLVAGLNDVCARLRRQDALGLTRFLIDHVEPAAVNDLAPVHRRVRVVAYDPLTKLHLRRGDLTEPPVRIAGLCHLVDADDLETLDQTFGELPGRDRERYLSHIAAFASPVVMCAADIRSRSGVVVRLYPIMLAASSRAMKGWIDGRHARMVHGLIQSGLDVARSLGCAVVSLGQYTSIGTAGGRSLTLTDIGLTTGNTYTSVLAVQAVRQTELASDRHACDSVLAVVGAAGNVGRACAETLAPSYRRTVLIGSAKPGSRSRLEKLSRRIPRADIATELSVVAAADTVIVAVNAIEPLLGPDDFARDAIVCDVSVPAAVSANTAALRPDLTIVAGGIARLPFGEAIGVRGFPLPAGEVYGCMAEAIILGFEGIRDSSFTGSITPDRIRFIAERAAYHGLELASSAPAVTAAAPSRRNRHAYAR
jgi:acetylornithine/succinyldiaminopimelate/putrescine aminotransferase/predicted amino acid dehydrogenase